MNLQDFIRDIHLNQIKQNSIVICNFSDEVKNKLQSLNLQSSDEIYLSVKRYKHITRDLKKHRNKAVNDEIIHNFKRFIVFSQGIYFDTLPKHKNILFINHYKGILFKIVVNLDGEIKTAGIIEESNLKDSYLIIIKQWRRESNPL